MTKKHDDSEWKQMTQAEINAFLKKKQEEQVPEAADTTEADKPKRGRPAKAETEAE